MPFDNSNLSASVPDIVKVLSKSPSSDETAPTAIPATFSAIEVAAKSMLVVK